MKCSGSSPTSSPRNNRFDFFSSTILLNLLLFGQEVTMSFNHIGQYVCKCGKVFNNSQSFNGHKGHCKVCLDENGTYNKYLERQSNITEKAREASSKNRKEKAEQKELLKKQKWESEIHYCEKCGKELPHKYEDRFGSGRFCSTACANSRTHSEETRAKVSLALKGKKSWNGGLILVHHEPKFCKTCGKELKWNNKSGYCSKCITSAPERHELRVEVGKKVAQKVKESGKGKY